MDKVTILSLVALLCCIIAPQIDSANTKSKPTASQKAPDNQWQTPPAIVEHIEEVAFNVGTKTWSFDNVKITTTKKRNRDYSMKWSKGSNKVEIFERYNDGKTVQSWKFEGNIRIKLVDSVNIKKELWRLKNATMYYLKDEEMEFTRLQWKNNIEDFEALKKYQGFISSWCHENESWVKADCEIYTAMSDKYDDKHQSDL